MKRPHFRARFARTALACASLMLTSSCAPRGPGGGAAVPTQLAKASREGTLITYKAGREFWRQQYRDDGETLVSELSFGGDRTATVRTSRSSRTVVVEDGPSRVERDIPIGTVSLENGDWQAYAIAADWYADAREPRPVKVLVPGQGAVLDGTIAVAPTVDGGREVKMTIGKLLITASVDPNGKVVKARVPAQSLEALPPDALPGTADARANARSPQATDAARILVQTIEVQQDGGTLSGELWTPKGLEGPVPLVVIVPGSGPTDRDGNSDLGLRTDAYKQMASALAQRGMATFRYDKRGIGRSRGYAEENISLTSSCRDLATLVQGAKSKKTFSSITLVGHSEGGLVALKSLDDVHPDALVLLAAPGRALGALLREQLIKTGVPADEIDKALVDARKGDAVSSTRAEMKAIFRPSVLPFLRSIIDVDPVALLRSTKVPTTIVQGDADRQTSLEDAQALHAGRPDSRLLVVAGMNHVLKMDATEQRPQQSYTDPAVPLAPDVVDAIVAASRK